ncbi:DUF3592 domain-containing protein [Pyxidicoccus caerfyrddinensis]|jgi:hypothetical protein|uniref:DUF3592 domain-containing protein n=1 Tax=Pyxidicoccus caerfyrddinensis TaxID=2709663 RepID=UPI0013DB1935|nr:DUF3592 domain-containing protein [Pyxidicoccus caerfyrddinensis]
MIRENPSVPILTGLVLLVLGVVIGGELLQDPSANDDPTVARPLRPVARAQGRQPAPSSAKLGASLVFISFGAGLSLYGFRQSKRQGLLLRDGVPVVGRVVHIHHERKRSSRLTYRFVDDQGQVREGVYATLFAGGPLDELQVGTEVTVVYDATDSRRHTLDVDHVRRADAELRRL